MRIIFMGSSEFAIPALKILATQYEIVAVYTKEPKPAGRGMKLRKTPLHIEAEKLGLPILTPKNFKSQDNIDHYLSYQADMTIVASYGLILPKILLDSPKYGALNIHGSILPRWRGAAPIHRAIMAGDNKVGVTIMQMSEGLDEGDMYDIWSMDVTDTLTTGEAHDILALQGGKLLEKVIEKIFSGQISAKPQSEKDVTYAHKILKDECEIQWNKPSEEIIRFINALNPFPAAFCFVNGVRHKVYQAVIMDENEDDQDFVFKTADGFIRLKEVQPEGKKRKILF